jgi:hypothetical protein
VRAADPFLKKGHPLLFNRTFPKYTNGHKSMYSTHQRKTRLTVQGELDMAAVFASFYLIYIFGECC